MIALACGVHEARRRIPCPVCPRVLAELREEAAEVRAFVVGSSTPTGAPAGQGKRGRPPKTTPGTALYPTRSKRLSEAQKHEIATRIRRGEKPSVICVSMGITNRTVRKWRNCA